MPTFSLSVNRHTEAVCRAGYKVIEVFVQGNSRKNELYLSRFLPIFEAQVCDAIAMHVYIQSCIGVECFICIYNWTLQKLYCNSILLTHSLHCISLCRWEWPVCVQWFRMCLLSWFGTTCECKCLVCSNFIEDFCSEAWYLELTRNWKCAWNVRWCGTLQAQKPLVLHTKLRKCYVGQANIQSKHEWQVTSNV